LRLLASSFLLAALFLALLVLELAPIAVVAATDGLWFMAVPEEFTATLWSPLKPLLPGSYFYHYFGFFYYKPYGLRTGSPNGCWALVKSRSPIRKCTARSSR
jgi:hypothetical protein